MNCEYCAKPPGLADNCAHCGAPVPTYDVTRTYGAITNGEFGQLPPEVMARLRGDYEDAIQARGMAKFDILIIVMFVLVIFFVPIVVWWSTMEARIDQQTREVSALRQ